MRNNLYTLLSSLLVITLAGCAPIKTQVESVSPAAGAIVNVDDLTTVTTIEVLFDHRMNMETLTSESFIVTGSSSGEISGTFAGVGENRRVVFTPLVPLLVDETIEVQLTGSIQSQSGKFLEPYSWNFTIDGEVIPPGSGFVLESMTPSIESLSTSPSVILQPKFSSPYNPFLASGATVVVEGSRSGTHVTTLQDVLIGIDTLHIATDRDFLAGERVTLALQNGLFGLDDTPLDPTIVGVTIRNLGSEWPGTQLDSGTALGNGRVVFLDSDADGIDEWAIVAESGTVVLQDATPSGLGSSDSWTLSELVSDAAVGDFDGDGRTDLICLGATGERLHLLRGSFSIALPLEDPVEISLATVATRLTVAHADEDGIADLLLSGSNGLSVAWGSAANPLTQQALIDASEVIGPPAASDVDGDDLIDLIAAQTDGSLLILAGDGGGNFTSEGTISGYSAAVGVLAGNLDGDGLRDLLVIPGGSDTPSSLLCDGDMNFSLRVLFNGVAHPGAQLVDWDGDGLLDCLTPVAGSSSLNFSAGIGDGNFAQPTTLAHGSPITSFNLGDADGDGALDIALHESAGNWQITRSEPINLPPADRFEVADLTVVPGELGVSFPVLLDCEQDLQGWTLVLKWEPDVMKVNDLDSPGTALDQVDFSNVSIDNTAGVGIVGVIVDFDGFGTQVLAAGTDYEIAIADADIENSAPAGDHLYGPSDGHSANASPPTDNAFVVAGQSVYPELVLGTITVDASPATDDGDPPSEEEPTFLRGDVNGDGSVNLTDGSQLQLWVTGVGTIPDCLDAADVNDDGVVNLSDPIELFDFLYQGSNPPPAPYPAAGPDPTADGLDCNR